MTVLERTNARGLAAERLPFRPGFVTADLSFISLTVALGPVLECLRDGFRGLVLVKPQFEAGRERVGKGGVVRDPAVHREVLGRVERGSSSVAPRCSAPATRGIRDRKATWSTSSTSAMGAHRSRRAGKTPAAAAARAVDAVFDA